MRWASRAVTSTLRPGQTRRPGRALASGLIDWPDGELDPERYR